MDIFQKIRTNRIAALALAKQRREAEFNPFRSSAIIDVQFARRSVDRGDLTLTLSEGQEVVLPNFYLRHAQRLEGLSSKAQLTFLKEIWLNYNAWRTRRPGNVSS